MVEEDEEVRSSTVVGCGVGCINMLSRGLQQGDPSPDTDPLVPFENEDVQGIVTKSINCNRSCQMYSVTSSKLVISIMHRRSSNLDQILARLTNFAT